MAGVIDIRYNWRNGHWTAKPRFGNPAWGFSESAPSAESHISPYMALCKLCEMLPEEMQRKLMIFAPRHFYKSPEYDWPDDKCIEVDGHMPSREEWSRRRKDYIRSHSNTQQS